MLVFFTLQVISYRRACSVCVVDVCQIYCVRVMLINFSGWPVMVCEGPIRALIAVFMCEELLQTFLHPECGLLALADDSLLCCKICTKNIGCKTWCHLNSLFTWDLKYSFWLCKSRILFIFLSVVTVSLSLCRGVFVLAASVWWCMLSSGRSASLYDTTDDEWLSEGKGVLETHALTHFNIIFLLHFSFSLANVLLPFSQAWRWATRMDKCLWCFKRNQSLLLSSKRGHGGQCGARLNYWD